MPSYGSGSLINKSAQGAARGGGNGALASSTYVKNRMRALVGQFPALVDQNDVLLQLALQETDDATMMDNAVSAIGMSEIHRIGEEMKSWDPIRQRGEWSAMTPAKQNALLNTGYQLPMEKKSEGFMDKVGGAIGSGVGFAGKALNVVTGVRGIKQVLWAMEYMGEEVSRVPRAAGYQNDAIKARNELVKKGIDPDQFAAQTGIYLPGGFEQPGGVTGLVKGLAGGGAGLFGFAPEQLLSRDFYKTWNHNGHEGDDDFLPTRQLEVYDDLYNKFPDSAATDFVLAREIAAGKDVGTIVEDEGFDKLSPEYTQRVTQVYEKMADPDFKNATSKLSAAHISPGRSLARQLGVEDGHMNDWSSPGRWISGGTDAMFGVLADPTMALGKLSQASKAARWGLRAGEAVEDVERFRQSAHIFEKARAGEDIADDLAAYATRGALARRGPTIAMDVTQEGKAVHGIAQRVVDAFDDTNTAYTKSQLMRDSPQIGAAMYQLQSYHNVMMAKRGYGIAEIDDVFDFYTEMAGARALVGGEGKAIGAGQSLFGVNPQFKSIPHTTLRAQAGMETKAWFRKTLIDGKPNSQLADDVTEAIHEVADAGDEVEDASEGGMDDLMNWQPEKKGALKKFTGAFTTHVAGRHVALGDQQAIEDFSRFVEYGSFAQMPRATMDRYMEMFIEGNTAQQAAVVNTFMADVLDHAGIADDVAGDAFKAKFIGHNSQAYGIDDRLNMGRIGEVDTRRLQTKDAILSSQVADHMAIPSYKDMVQQTRKANSMRRVAAWNHRAMPESFMGKVWKPVQMMRLGFILRNAGEETIQMMGRNSPITYLRSKIATDWMTGVKGSSINRGRELAQSAWMRPITASTHGMRSLLGVSDEALHEAAVTRAIAEPTYAAANAAGRQTLIDEAKMAMGRERRFVPQSVMHMDEWARFTSRTMSKGFHDIAQMARVPTKVELGKMIAGPETYNYLISNSMIMSGEGSGHWGELIGGNTFKGASAYERDPSRYTHMYDPNNPSGLKAIQMRTDKSNYRWYTRDDIEGYYWGMSNNIDSAISSVQGQAGFRALSSYTNPDTFAAYGKVTGIADKAELRASVNSLRGEMQSLAPMQKDQMRSWLKTGNPNLVVDPELRARIEPFKDLEHRQLADLFSVDGVSYTTHDLDFTKQVMVNRVYGSLRRADNEHVIRKMIRMNADTSNVLKEGVSRVYVPMIDRRAAEGVTAVFSTEEGAAAFAENLAQALKAKGMANSMAQVWDSAVPGFSGFSLEDWMNSIKSQIAMDGEQWIPSALTASRNADMAIAIRDAMSTTLDQLGAPQALKPTIGYMDFASDAMDERWGLHDVGNEIYHVEPTAAIKARALDPTSMQTHFKIEMPADMGGGHQWVPESEMDTLIHPIQASNVPELLDDKLDNFATFERGKLRINTDAIEDDWANGAGYLRGEGRSVSKTAKQWKYTSQHRSQQLEKRLATLEYQDRTFPDLGELTSRYRNLTKVERAEMKIAEGADYPEWVMHDKMWGPLAVEGTLEDFIPLADTATSTKGVTRKVKYTVQNSESRAMPILLEQQGIDVDKLVEKLGSSDRYREFIVEREKARLGLANRKVREGTELTPEAIRQEHAAILESLRRMEIDPHDIAIEGREIENVAYRFADNEEKGYKILDSIVGSGETEDFAVRRAAEDAVNELLRTMTTKDGDVMHELLHHANANDFDMRDLWDKGRIQDMPEKAYGPTYVTPSDSSWEKIVRGYFDGWANPAISALSRTPMYRHNVAVAQNELRWVYDNMADKELASAAHTAMKKFGAVPEDFNASIRFHMNTFDDVEGDPWNVLKDRQATTKERRDAIGSIFGSENNEMAGAIRRLDDTEVESIVGWMRNDNLAWNTWRDASLEHGRKMTIPFIDDHNVRSQFQEYIGSLIPFWYSEEQFLKRTVRGLAQTPQMLRKGQLTMHAMRSMGVVRKDENGNDVFVYPGSAEGLNAIAKSAEMVTGGKFALPTAMPLQAQTKYMIPGFNSDQAGKMNFGPMIGLPMEYLSRRMPEWEEAQVNAFGDTSEGSRPWYDYLMPASVTKTYRAWVGDATKGDMASAQMQAIQMLESADKGLPENASPLEKESYLEDVRSMARTIGTIRALTYFTTFSTASPVDRNVYGKELKEMLNDGVDWPDAVRILTEQYGAKALPYTVFASQSGQNTNAPIPYTKDAAAFMDVNEDYLKTYKSAAAWLLPVDKGDKFSRRAYDESLALELRRRRSPEEMLNAIYNAQAAPDFFEKQKEMRGQIVSAITKKDKNLEKAYKQEWANWRDSYYAQHPVFAEDRKSGAGQAKRKTTIDEMQRVINDPMAPKSESMDGIREIMGEYEKLQSEISALSLIKGDKGRKLKAKAIEAFRTYQWMHATPTSDRFFSSVIEPDLESDDVTLTREAKEATAVPQTQRTA